MQYTSGNRMAEGEKVLPVGTPPIPSHPIASDSTGELVELVAWDRMGVSKQPDINYNNS